MEGDQDERLFVDENEEEEEEGFMDRTEEGDEEILIDENEVIESETDEPMHQANTEENGKEEQDDSVQFFEHKDAVYSVTIHPKLPDVGASGGGDDKAFIWNMKDGKQLQELSGHKDSVTCVRFNFDGKLIATSSYDGTVRVYETWSGKLVQTLEGPGDGIDWIVWHERGNVVLAGSQDGSCWLWNAQTGACMNAFVGHAAPVTCGAFSLDGKQVITGSADATMRVWDPKTAQTLHIFKGNLFFQSPVSSLAVHPTQASTVVVGAEDGSAKVVNIATGKILGSVGGHADSIESIGFCHVASLPFFFTASLDQTVKIWDLTTLQCRATLQHDDGVIKAIWHPSQALLFTASMDTSIRLWDARTGKVEKLWKGHKMPILDLALSVDGNTILTGSDDNSALVFKVNKD